MYRIQIWVVKDRNQKMVDYDRGDYGSLLEAWKTAYKYANNGDYKAIVVDPDNNRMMIVE